MISVDEDDTHFCLKCHTTIHGLENYINHRKSGCTTQSSHQKSRTPSPLIEPDFSLKADDFFSLLELQSSSKKSINLQVPSTSKANPGVLTRSKTAVQKGFFPEKRQTDWIGGHHLRELGNEDNQTKLINAVDNISGSIKKEEPQRLTYPEIEEDSNEDFSEEDESEEDCHAPPRTHTGGKWKPTSSPIQWTDWDTPPPSHTGGKWKPTLPKNLVNSSEENFPPPNHTKGKWIPGRNPQTSTNNKVEIIPPLRKSSGTVQYWCGPCNRRLASKIVYERHLKSDLHYKRTLHEREFDDPLAYLMVKKEEVKKVRKVKEGSTKKKKSKTMSSIRCEVCRSKVFTHLMGKHLISHYHCRKRDFSKSLSQKMVLENIQSVVLQAPFQCGKCRFYCNTMEYFMEHWRSILHTEISLERDEYFYCGFCKFQCEENGEMEDHLTSEIHQEVVLAINRSMPIIIKKIQPIKCGSCSQKFKYNMEMLLHCKKNNHQIFSTGSDLYQDKHRCPDCPMVLRSKKALQNHLQKKHDKNFFFCTPCNLVFGSHHDSKVHRRSQKHKFQVLGNSSNVDFGKTCKICYEKFANILFLKEHLRTIHPEHSYSCSRCGAKFTLSQEVTRHIRTNSCKFELDETGAHFFSCEHCPYKSDSQAEFVFHEVLHTDPVFLEIHGKSKKTMINYKCPICQKIFSKASLRCHIRLHFNEKPYKCTFCRASYARKCNLQDHIKVSHGKIPPKGNFCEVCDFTLQTREEKLEHLRLNHAEKNLEDIHVENYGNQPKFICSYCGKTFLKKYTLQQHMIVHTGKEIHCPNSDCLFRARTSSDLRNHMVTHSQDTPFECEKCDFRTKTKQQLNRHLSIHEEGSNKKFSCQHCSFTARLSSHLKRHLRLHTGAKPYKCPHCEYTCNNLENLRKHIISTNKHPGKFIYECKFCQEPHQQYATNFAKDFRVHLVTDHGDQFESSKIAASYILGIYNAAEDPKITAGKCQNSKTTTAERKSLGSLASLPSTSRGTDEGILLTTAVDDPGPSGHMDVIYVELTDSWCMEGYYDVGESGTLVPFSSGDQFDQHDQDE